MCLCSRIKTSEKCGVMVGVGRNRGCFKPPLSSRPALWFLSCCRERNAPAASRKKSRIERFILCKKGWDKATAKELEREDVLLPQSASLTAPSEKEPDNALSDIFLFLPSQSCGQLSFRPLSLATLDSSPGGRTEKITPLKSEFFVA